MNHVTANNSRVIMLNESISDKAQDGLTIIV